MSQIVKLPTEMLPAETHYRPLSRSTYVGGLLGWLGVTVGLLWATLSGALGVLGLLGTFACYAVFVGWSMSRRKKAFSYIKSNDDAVAMLAAGEVTQAEAIFEQLAHESRTTPFYHTLFVYNRGVTFLRQCQPDRALQLFAAAHNAGWLSNPNLPYAAMIMVGLSSAYLQKGDLASADYWRQQAHARTSLAKWGTLLHLDAAYGARLGRYAEVVEDTRARWSSAEGALPGPQLRGLRLVQAFALSHLDRTPAQQQELGELLAGCKPFRMGEYDYMALSWPEFQHFLVAHGFSDPRVWGLSAA